VKLKKGSKRSVSLVKVEGKKKIKILVPLSLSLSLSLSLVWAALGDQSLLFKVEVVADFRSCQVEVVRVEVLLLLGRMLDQRRRVCLGVEEVFI